MNKKTPNHIKEDFLVDNLKAWMKFQVIEKTALKKKELDNGWIVIVGVSNFKFQKDDIICIDEVWKKTVRFHVQRGGKDKAKKEKVIEFEFNKLIFVQRFESFTDLDNVIDNVKAVTDWLLGNQE